MVNGYGVREYVNLPRKEIFRRARGKWQAKCPRYCNAIRDTVENALGGWPCGWMEAPKEVPESPGVLKGSCVILSW